MLKKKQKLTCSLLSSSQSLILWCFKRKKQFGNWGIDLFTFIKWRLLFVKAVVWSGSSLNSQSYLYNIYTWCGCCRHLNCAVLSRRPKRNPIGNTGICAHIWTCYFTKHLEEERDSVYFYCLQCSYTPKMHTENYIALTVKWNYFHHWTG